MPATITLSVNPEVTAHQASHDASSTGEPLGPTLHLHAGNPAWRPLPISTRELTMDIGEVVFIAGPNGVGKSALLTEIGRDLRRAENHVETFYGNRHIQFQSDDIDQVGHNFEQLQSQLIHVTRFRNTWGEQHLKSVLRRVNNQQAQSAHNIVEAQESGTKFEAALAANPPIIRTINSVFSVARLPIEIILSEGGLRARRGNAEYGIERLSDGERAALLLAGAILVQPAKSFVLIDEPERHLNPAISGALLAALTRSRSDIGFVFASHDLELVNWLRPEQIVHVRDSTVIEKEPERRRYDLDVLQATEGVPEELRSAILGTRQRLLIVEGNANSEDRALYSQIYIDWNIVPRGGWEEVVNSVKSLARNDNYHWLNVVGIIDRDGRSPDEQEELAADGIYCLPVPMIENLFLAPFVLSQMAAVIHKLKGGIAGANRIAKLERELPRWYDECRDDLISKRLIWDVNRQISERKVSLKALRSGQARIEAIDIEQIKRRLTKEFDEAVSGNDPLTMLTKFAIKNSSIPNRVAKSLGFDDFKDYGRSTLHQIEGATPTGTAILNHLRQEMPKLPGRVATQTANVGNGSA